MSDGQVACPQRPPVNLELPLLAVAVAGVAGRAHTGGGATVMVRGIESNVLFRGMALLREAVADRWGGRGVVVVCI